MKTCIGCGEKFRAIKDTKSRKQIYCSRYCYIHSKAETQIEKKVREWLDANNIKNVPQFKVGSFFVDFYLPCMGVVIEADGDYWHSLKRVKKRDARKNEWMKENGIPMFRLGEAEINENVDFAIRRRWTKFAKENDLEIGSGGLE